jgi:ABC-type glycerol-3-phosphate transport system substrate-binding protein
MKKLFSAVIVIAALYVGLSQVTELHGPPGAPATATEAVARAFEDRQSGVQVEGEGTVVKVLPDDNDGSRHQRFILRLASGQTLLVAHNIDIAPRVPSLESGDPVRFNGVYEWNEQGGVVHWTHRDPNGTHQAGWLMHDGETYQ